MNREPNSKSQSTLMIVILTTKTLINHCVIMMINTSLFNNLIKT